MTNFVVRLLFLVCLAAGFILMAYSQFQVNHSLARSRIEARHILFNQASGENCNQLQMPGGVIYED